MLKRKYKPKTEISGVPFGTFLLRNSGAGSEGNPDPFDRLYGRWAAHAVDEHSSIPSREMWDKIILFLISSKDPERMRLYRRIDAEGPDTLGSDAYELWRKVPNYTANRSIPFTNWEEFDAYAKAHEGSMRRVMEKAGLGERYNNILEEVAARKAQVRRGQAGVVTLGCIGLSAIAFMALTVLLVIGLRLLS